MSDQTNGNGTADAMPQLAINAQYVKDLSFESPNAPQSLLPGQDQPQVQVNVNVSARGVAEDMFEVEIQLNAQAKSGESQTFLVELVYAGLFTIKNIPQESLEAVCLIECPRLIFPFARRIVADATRDGGFPPLMLEPIDFADLYRRGKMAQAPAGNA
jgi:preprotein translocase subunit SecB